MSKLSLANQHILVTREKRQAAPFKTKIEEYGGQAFIADLLKINCKKLDDSLYTDKYQWIFFTSANGVNCFFQQIDKHELQQVKFAAVGVKTNQALQNQGFEADFIPSVFDAKTMSKEFLDMNQENVGKILLVRGNLSRPEILQAFGNAGVEFDSVVVYETAVNYDAKAKLNSILHNEDIHFITFTSPSTVDAFIALCNTSRLKNVKVICIGTTTEKSALEHGLENVLIPKEFTIEGMLHVMCEEVKKNGKV